jgi:hypothetical protein
MPLGISQQLTEPLTAGANLVGSDLYNKLSLYFISHFKGMIEASFASVLGTPTLT